MARVRVLQNDFAKVADGLNGRLTRVADETIRDIERDAKARATRGWLKRSIHRRGRSTGARGSIKRTIWADWRWHFVNDGTREQPAAPFIDPAVEAAKAKFFRRVVEAIGGGR